VTETNLLDFRLFALGGAPVTVGGLATAIAIVIAAVFLSKLATRALDRLRNSAKHGKDSLYLVEKLVGYGVVLAGFFIAVSALGVNLSSLAVFAGALGVGVGLGLQGVVKEFVSGLVVILDRSVQVGDFVDLENGVSGVVQEIGPRATRVRNNDNQSMLVPNSRLVERTVTNDTYKGQNRRIHVPFSVAYGVDKEKVRDAVLAAARAVPFTSPDTETQRTQVWLTGFGDSALEFELIVWPTVDAVKRPAAMRAAYAWAIDDALRQACIEIPFPQVDVRLRSLFGVEGEGALKALRLERENGAQAAIGDVAESHNDAVDELLAQAEAEQRGAKDVPGAAPETPEPRG
jgi:small-conductance mechanosensitive channel